MKRIVSIISAVAVGAVAMWILAMSVGNATPTTRATTTDITYKEGVCSSKGAACRSVKAGKSAFGFGSR